MKENGTDKFLETEIAELEVAAANFAARFIPDAKVRMDYLASTKKASQEIQEKLLKGSITPKEAARQAQSMRNIIMNAMRGNTSDFGLAMARFLKKEGKTIQQLEARYSHEMFRAEFEKLNESQKGEIWRKIVSKAGEPQVMASNSVRWLGHAGRGLFVLTAVISVYHIYKAEDRVRATANEVTALGGAMAGSAALGSAGLFCGPAAIACVPLGVFVGGVIGALGADWVFDRIW